jgi:hypothetical protein
MTETTGVCEAWMSWLPAGAAGKLLFAEAEDAAAIPPTTPATAAVANALLRMGNAFRK